MTWRRVILLISIFILLVYFAADFGALLAPLCAIEGNIIWRENKLGSDKPDTGAQIYLFQGNKLVHHTFTDENGDYRVGSLEPGNYTLYLASGNVRRNILEDNEIVDSLKAKLWQSPEVDRTGISYSVGFKVTETTVNLPPFSNKSVNTDFGTTYTSSHLESDILRYKLYH